MKFTDREKAIKKESHYAERKFTQLLEQVDKLEIPPNATEEEINEALLSFDLNWRKICDHLVYLKENGREEFLKVARERMRKKIIVSIE